MARKARACIKITGECTGEIYVEAVGESFKAYLKRWDEDHSQPCPMPVDHSMFSHPEDYGCAPYELELTLPM